MIEIHLSLYNNSATYYRWSELSDGSLLLLVTFFSRITIFLLCLPQYFKAVQILATLEKNCFMNSADTNFNHVLW